ncbi:MULTISPECIES: DUF4236 domain-containing protein [Acinetobacter calcoaceticus/baumannii complex]|jgi:hypothetical protein|uniref:DUF4236 domain-containing protein n=1 Tax=Acinetobacter calcoaceticus/baumannii complex TaxID=909768 RepID=UPI0001AEFA20|nr:hypothetical protein CSB70_1827 [Acinetobacter baumannii]EJP43395.1 PF14020 family protein [Acinetobacter baumannii OIFC032]EKP33071.1 PF14020 family protein [Acinetobacter baumannii OIFC099]EKP42895.1 PF14020 family protein [Acinetobacter baumannii OIFC087]ENU77036.1 hypothetical protein F976_01795 [Acinetobacter baumannii NIPH 1734]EXD53166.1 hypothetical protein J498_2318 [Acinetobacter baumannii 781407]EXE24126.1 hypothetical protein J564_3801 [Acinetobacter baumannii 1525283]POV74960
MGFNFRKSFKIAPGLRLNVGKKGISSVSIGGKGARVNLSKKGTRTTVGIPGTGLSYSNFISHKKKAPPPLNSYQPQPFIINTSTSQMPPNRSVSFLLGFGIFWMPYIFAWFTLRSGYSSTARWISFIWMIFVLLIVMAD